MVLLLLPLVVLVASCAAASASAGIHKRLVALAEADGGVIKLNASTYHLLTTPKRDWSASIEFTALDSRWNCGPCADLQPRWKAVAHAWWSKVPTAQRDRHFFATFDYDDNRATQDVMRKLALQTAPMILFYPPTEGENATGKGEHTVVHLSSHDSSDSAFLAKHLSQYTPIPIPYVPPVDWARRITSTIAVVAAAAILRLLAPVLLNRWSWAAGAIVSSLVMTSGFMFTRIRNTPQVGGGGEWVAHGSRDMFGREVPMVAAAYGLLGFSFLMLITVVPSQSSAQRQRIHVYIWSAVIMGGYSLLIVLYKVKNGYYPFRLLL